MSACLCAKCEQITLRYDKYCPDCVKRYGVPAYENFWRLPHDFDDWDTWRKAEFQKDIAYMSTIHVSKDVQPETDVLAVEHITKKKRKRSHAKYNH